MHVNVGYNIISSAAMLIALILVNYIPSIWDQIIISGAKTV